MQRSLAILKKAARSGILMLCLQAAAFPVAAQNLGSYRPDAQGIGLGGSVVAMSRDQAAIFWNPAILSGLKSTGFLVSMSDPFEGRLFSMTQFVPRIGTFGAGLSRISSGARDVDTGSIAWGRAVSRWFRVGGTLNIEKAGAEWTGAADWGIFLGDPTIGTSDRSWQDTDSRSVFDRLSLGATIKSIPLGQQFFDTSVLLGLGVVLPFSNLILNTGLDLNPGSDTGHFGVGYAVNRHLTVFGGLDDLRFENVGIAASYSLRTVSFNLAYSARLERALFTLSTRIGPGPIDLARPHYRKAMNAVKSGQYARASTEFQKFLAYETRAAAEDTARQMVYSLQNRQVRVAALIDSLLGEADNVLSADEPQLLRAALLYARIVKLDPDNKRAAKQLDILEPAVNNFLQKSLDDAIVRFESGQAFSARKLFQRILIFDRENETALYYLSIIDKMLSERAEDYFYQGIGYFKQGNYAEAQAALQLALQYNPKLREAEDYLSRTNERMRQQQSRLGDLLREASRLEGREEYVGATNKYLEVLKIDQDNSVARLAIERLRPNVKRLVAARYQDALDEFAKGNLPEAEQLLKRVLTIEPNYLGAKRTLAKVREEVAARTSFYLEQAENAFAAGDLSKAREIYEDVLEIDADNEHAVAGQDRVNRRDDVIKLLTQAYEEARSNHNMEALATLARAREIEPNNGDVKAQIVAVTAKVAQLVVDLYNKGINLYTRDKYEEAKRYFDRVLELEPGHKGAREYIEKTQQRILALKRLN